MTRGPTRTSLRTPPRVTPEGAMPSSPPRSASPSTSGQRVVIASSTPPAALLALRRTEDAQPASDQVAIDKARTAAIFVRPSREMEEQVNSGRLGGARAARRPRPHRGDPALVDGEVVGAIGTSGETTGAGRGGLDRGSRRHVQHRRGPGADLRRRTGSPPTRPRRSRPSAVSPRRRRRRRRRRPRPSVAAGRRAGRERRRRYGQGAHRGAVPAAQQGLRGPGVRRAALRAAPGRRRAAPGRACRSRSTGTSWARSGVSGASSADEDQELAGSAQRPGRRRCRRSPPPRRVFFPSQVVRESSRPAGCSSTTAATRSTRAAATRPARWNERRRHHARRREQGHVVEGGALREPRGVGPARRRDRRRHRAWLRGRRARHARRRPAPVRRRVGPVPLLRGEGGV